MHKAQRISLFLLLTLLRIGCASDDGAVEDDPEVSAARGELKCNASVLESDLDSDLMGPAAVSGELELPADKTYIVSSTYGIPKRVGDSQELPPRYQQLMGRIIEQLQGQPGLLALQLSSSPSCSSGRTLAIWESEELMYEFVTSPPHLEAMGAANELLQPGYAVTHWTADTREQMSLTAAVEHMADER
jgi:heme-degrading monooxygenase HmoA